MTDTPRPDPAGSAAVDGHPGRVDDPARSRDANDHLRRLTAQIRHLRDGLVAADRQMTNLRAALASNRRIGMAIGILMAIHRVSQQEAFDLLRVTSQRANRKLREIAEHVVLTGVLPAE